MCNQPDAPKNGEYKCHWENFDSKKDAKKHVRNRRESEESIDYDRSDGVDSDVFQGDADFFKKLLVPMVLIQMLEPDKAEPISEGFC